MRAKANYDALLHIVTIVRRESTRDNGRDDGEENQRDCGDVWTRIIAYGMTLLSWGQGMTPLPSEDARWVQHATIEGAWASQQALDRPV